MGMPAQKRDSRQVAGRSRSTAALNEGVAARRFPSAAASHGSENHKPSRSLIAHRSSLIFRGATVTFSRDHPRFLRPTFFSAAPAGQLQDRTAQGFGRSHAPFQLLAQFFPGDLPVGGLRPFALAAHLNPGRPVPETNCGRGLIDFLATRAGTAHKSLLHVGTQNSQRIQSGLNLSW
jgi:hypothetical protein